MNKCVFAHRNQAQKCFPGTRVSPVASMFQLRWLSIDGAFTLFSKALLLLLTSAHKYDNTLRCDHERKKICFFCSPKTWSKYLAAYLLCYFTFEKRPVIWWGSWPLCLPLRLNCYRHIYWLLKGNSAQWRTHSDV